MTLDPSARATLLSGIVDAAVMGGLVVWQHFEHTTTVEYKSDDSPVTLADRAAEEVILCALRQLAPQIPIIAEEEVSSGRVPAVGDSFFLVDPLDGTKEFIQRSTDFTVNIGLIEERRPTMGVVYAPARSMLYWGDTVSGVAWQATQPPQGNRGPSKRIAVVTPHDPPRAVASKSHNTPATEAWLRAARVEQRVAVGSSLKFVMVATGEADVYPRPAPTMEWDTAAGDAVLRASGGRVLDLDGQEFMYAKEAYRNPGFIATAGYEPAALRPFLMAAEVRA